MIFGKNLQFPLEFNQSNFDQCYIGTNVNSFNKRNKLSLIEHKLDFIPRDFTITTNKGSYKFNTNFLKSTSSVIFQLLQNNPDNLTFHINVSNESNMKKIEDLYQGLEVTFDSKDFLDLFSIIKALQLGIYFETYEESLSIQFFLTQLKSYLQNTITDTFTIIVNGKEYKFNGYGVYSSAVIRELRSQKVSKYIYNFNDENNVFQLISVIFNFEEVEITTKNMKILQKIATDLKIESILSDINNFIQTNNSKINLFEDKKATIENIEQTFYWLYNIKDITVKTVVDSIISSSWCKSEECVQELAACILHVISTSCSLHSHLIELLVSLEKCSEQTDKSNLNILLPFIIKHLLNADENLYCPFLNKLLHAGKISMNEIIDEIVQFNACSTDNAFNINNYNQVNAIKYRNNIYNWFFPELIESKKITEKELLANMNQQLIQKYYPKNIENFKKMRDSYEPDDNIILSLKYDDVDTFQSLASKEISNNNRYIFNMFDNFNYYGKSYINYACEYGSIKCLKHLLSKGATIDQYTIGFAVLGGNQEIIDTIYNMISKDSTISIIDIDGSIMNKILNNNFDVNCLNNAIIPAIIYHRNDLFDRFIEMLCISKQPYNNFSLQILIYFSLISGNIHSFLKLIDKEFDFNSIIPNHMEVIFHFAAKNGFCCLLELLIMHVKIMIPKFKLENMMYRESSVIFGNLSIFILYHKTFFKNDKNYDDILYKCLLFSINKDYPKIVHYIIDNLYHKDNKTNNANLIKASIGKKTDSLFKYIKSKLKIELSLTDYENYLGDFCSSGNIDAIRSITDNILQKDPNFLFTCPFIQACDNLHDEICEYFISKKVSLDFCQLASSIKAVCKVKDDIILTLIDLADAEIKRDFCQKVLNQAFEYKNKNIIQTLFKIIPPNNKSLFDAVNCHDVEIVNIILNYNSSPSFINQISSEGTALYIAVCNNDIDIVKRLIQLPGINPNLYQTNDYTPLISAIISFNIDMLNLLLDFYGNDIESQLWQIEKALIIILKKLSSDAQQQTMGIKRQISILNQQIQNQKQYNQFNKQTFQQQQQYLNFQQSNFISKNPQQLYQQQKQQYLNFQQSNFISKNPQQLYQQQKQINLILPVQQQQQLNFQAINQQKINLQMLQLQKLQQQLLFPFNYPSNETLLKVITRLTQIKNININCHIHNYSFLIHSVEKNDINLLNFLLKFEQIDVNLYESINGNTPLMIAVENNNFEIAKILIEFQQTNINLKNYYHETALTIAVSKQLTDIISLLLTSEKFDPKESYLDYAFFISSEIVSKQLYKEKELNVNYINNMFQQFNSQMTSHQSDLDLSETSLIHAVNLCQLQKVELIISHSSFDPIESNAKAAVFAAVSRKANEIFKILIKLLNNDVNIRSQNRTSLFIYSLQVNNQEITDFIFNNKNFDPRKSDIINVLFAVLEENQNHSNFAQIQPQSFNLIDNLMKCINKFSIECNCFSPSGNSFFTAISNSTPNISTVVQFFLDQKVDPNAPDKNGIYPLQHAIELDSLPFIESLLSSEKIDLSVKLNENKTFLHLAAKSSNELIFKALLDRNAIDINAVDDEGETPLMKACKTKQDQNIKLLFQRNDLDYLHCNNNGLNALDLIRNKKSFDHSDQTNIDKKQYLDQLLNSI